MNWLIVTPQQKDGLDAINFANADRKCSTFQTIDGVLVTASDKIGDPYWSDYQELLTSMTPYSGEPTFPQPIE